MLPFIKKMFIPISQIDESLYYTPVCNRKIKKIESCGIICRYIHNNELYLLVVKGKIGQKWGFPKGNKIDTESERECAIRETYEETGLVINLDTSAIRVPLTRNIYFIYTVPSIIDTQFYTRCMSPSILPIESELDSDEIEDIRWMTIPQLQKHINMCNKDLKTILSGKKLWFMEKIFTTSYF